MTPAMVSHIAFSAGLVVIEAVGLFAAIPRVTLALTGFRMQFPTGPTLVYLASDLVLQVGADLGFISDEWSWALSMALLIGLVVFVGARHVRPK